MGEVKLREGDKFWLTKSDGACCQGWWVWEMRSQCFIHATQHVAMSAYDLKWCVERNSDWLLDGVSDVMVMKIYTYEYMAEQLIAEGSL